MDNRLENGPFPLTPSFKRVKAKVDKFTEKRLYTRELAQQHLKSVLAHQAIVKDKNDQPGTIVQKYSEIYGHQARRLIDWDDAKKDKVINMIKERQKKAKQKSDDKEKKRLEKEALKAAKEALNSIN